MVEQIIETSNRLKLQSQDSVYIYKAYNLEYMKTINPHATRVNVDFHQHALSTNKCSTIHIFKINIFFCDILP